MRLHIVPMANPDGVTISQSAKADDALRRIHQADVRGGLTDLGLEEYLRGWKANYAGVDINRNFDAGWQALGGRQSASYSHFKGEAPHDQSETQALVDYTRARDFDATVSYHAYGSCLYWQYGADTQVNERSRQMARAVRGVTRYPLASSSGLDAGGYKDWAMDVLSIPSITIEIGTRECPLPADEFYTIWERNRQVLQAVGQWVLAAE